MLVILVRPKDDDASASLVVEIGRVTHAAVSNYVVIERDASGVRLSEGSLDEYPRWSEPVCGLAARALSALPQSAGHEPTSNGALFVKVGIGSYERGLREELDHAVVPALERSEATRTRTLTALCNKTWQQNSVPAMPKPLEVPIRCSPEGIVYVRMSDIPPVAREEFERRMRYSTVPESDGHGPCAYAWDWESFLNGGR